VSDPISLDDYADVLEQRWEYTYADRDRHCPTQIVAHVDDETTEEYIIGADRQWGWRIEPKTNREVFCLDTDERYGALLIKVPDVLRELAALRAKVAELEADKERQIALLLRAGNRIEALTPRCYTGTVTPNGFVERINESDAVIKEINAALDAARKGE